MTVANLRAYAMTQYVRGQVFIMTRQARAARGQGMVEYALILAFIAILVIVALKFLQPSISRTLNNVSNSL